MPAVYDISNNEYHSSAGISRSSLCAFKSSPLEFWDQYLNPNKPTKEESRDKIIGNAVHTLVMQPELFEKEYIIKQKADGRTKEGKAYNEAFLKTSGSKIIIEEDWMDLINKMVESTRADELVISLLADSDIEKSIYWIDSETEILCKARPDIWKGNKIIDVKTTDDPTVDAFVGSVFKYNYHIQAAMQIDAIYEITGKLIDHFGIIAIPKKRPFKPYFYRMPDSYIDQGRAEYKDLLKIARACFDKGSWDLDRRKFIDLPERQIYTKQSVRTCLEVYEC